MAQNWRIDRLESQIGFESALDVAMVKAIALHARGHARLEP